MDIPNTQMNHLSPRHRRTTENRRDTISVRLRPVSEVERKKWFGASPTPVPETDRKWRPSVILL